MNDILYLIIPCYNEEEVLPETAKRVKEKLRALMEQKRISEASKALFVNDGSRDRTWEIITRLHKENNLFTGISLAHNSGEQNAYIAGMMSVKDRADMVITMDADLQDDIDAIDEMVAEYYKGNDVVYGVRNRRKTDSAFKKVTSKTFYKLMKWMGTELVPDHSQYRLMSRRAVEALSGYGEVNMFLPALVPLIGFKHTVVFHERRKRFAGESKYSAKKLVLLAVEAVTSFSSKPIQMIGWLAGLSLLVALGGVTAMLVQKIQYGVVPAWLILFSSLWAVGFIQLLAVRIIGEYIGKTYQETKKRPRYSIETSYLDEE